MAEPEGAPDPFAVLGLDPGVDDAGLRQAYRAAVQRHPPERDPEGFRRVRAAYEALRDPRARMERLLAEPILPPLDAAVLQAVPPPPSRADLLTELRAALLAGTDLVRRAFPEDLREPWRAAPGPGRAGDGR